MPNHTLIPPTLQTPVVSYRMLSYSAMADDTERAERDTLIKDFEICVAQRILLWFSIHPDYLPLLHWVMAVPYSGVITLPMTAHIRAPLWGATDAHRWLRRYDVGSYADALWQLAIVRLSAYLNTGSWDACVTLEGDER